MRSTEGSMLMTTSIAAEIKICRNVREPSVSPTDNMRIPARKKVYRYNQEIAWKCGNCQKKKIKNSSHAPPSRRPVAAAQPIIGGIAPGNAPTNVAHTVRFFKGV